MSGRKPGEARAGGRAAADVSPQARQHQKSPDPAGPLTGVGAAVDAASGRKRSRALAHVQGGEQVGPRACATMKKRRWRVQARRRVLQARPAVALQPLPAPLAAFPFFPAPPARWLSMFRSLPDPASNTVKDVPPSTVMSWILHGGGGSIGWGQVQHLRASARCSRWAIPRWKAAGSEPVESGRFGPPPHCFALILKRCTRPPWPSLYVMPWCPAHRQRAAEP